MSEDAMTEELKPLPCPFEEWFEGRFGSLELAFKDGWKGMARETWDAALATRSPAWRDDRTRYSESYLAAAEAVAHMLSQHIDMNGAEYVWHHLARSPVSKFVGPLRKAMEAYEPELEKARGGPEPIGLHLPLSPEEGRG